MANGCTSQAIARFKVFPRYSHLHLMISTYIYSWLPPTTKKAENCCLLAGPIAVLSRIEVLLLLDRQLTLLACSFCPILLPFISTQLQRPIPLATLWTSLPPNPSLHNLLGSNILHSDPHLPCNSCVLTSVLPPHEDIKSRPLILLSPHL